MVRQCYQLTLFFHPPYFREQFAEEMLWIFDQTSGEGQRLLLVLDSIVSLVRQWTLRRALRNRPGRSGEDVSVAGPVFQILQTSKPHTAALLSGAAVSSGMVALILLGTAQQHIPAFAIRTPEPSGGGPHQAYVIPHEGEPGRIRQHDACWVSIVEYWQLPASLEEHVRRSFPIRTGTMVSCFAPLNSISALHEVHPALQLGFLITRERTLSVRISMASKYEPPTPHMAFSASNGRHSPR